jgi:hypothetical protein
LKASIIRRIEKLEEQFKPSDPEPPPLDFDLLIESESAKCDHVLAILRMLEEAVKKKP